MIEDKVLVMLLYLVGWLLACILKKLLTNNDKLEV